MLGRTLTCAYSPTPLLHTHGHPQQASDLEALMRHHLPLHLVALVRHHMRHKMPWETPGTRHHMGYIYCETAGGFGGGMLGMVHA